MIEWVCQNIFGTFLASAWHLPWINPAERGK